MKISQKLTALAALTAATTAFSAPSLDRKSVV